MRVHLLCDQNQIISLMIDPPIWPFYTALLSATPCYYCTFSYRPGGYLPAMICGRINAYSTVAVACLPACLSYHSSTGCETAKPNRTNVLALAAIAAVSLSMRTRVHTLQPHLRSLPPNQAARAPDHQILPCTKTRKTPRVDVRMANGSPWLSLSLPLSSPAKCDGYDAGAKLRGFIGRTSTPLGFEFHSREYRSWGTRTWDLFYFPFLKVVDFDCKPDLYILLRRVQSTASTACR